MLLSDYIREVGVAEFAERFNFTERVVISYLYRWRRPGWDEAKRIVKDSPVTWEGIADNVREPASKSA